MSLSEEVAVVPVIPRGEVPARGAGRAKWSLRGRAPVLWVAGAALVLWLATGVSAADAGMFMAYQLIYVIAPGWVVYRLLRPTDTMALRQLTFGWGLGYVLEVLAFAGTAAIGGRGLLTLYPLVVFAAGLLLWRSRVGSGGLVTAEGIELPPGWGWVVAGLCVVAMAYLGVEYFGAAPLPNQVNRVSYGIDTVWYLSIASEALHHWPVGDPTVAGQPLFYHLFSSFDPAATSQVTGIALPTVFFRLYMLPMVVLTVLGVSLAGATFGGAWAGPIAAALALFVGEVNLDPHVGYKFANEMGDDIVAISPSFLLGAALFAPALILLRELWARARVHRLPYGTLAVFGLLVLGAVGAKAPIAPVLAGGLALYLIWHLVAKRSLHRPLLAALGVTGLAFAAFWLLAYGGAGSDQLALDPPGTIRQMAVTAHVVSLVGSGAGWIPALWAGLTVVGFVGAYGPQLVGVLGAHGGQARATGLLLAVFAVGQVPYLLYTHPGLSQVFFSEYGLLAACLVSAEGIRALWVRAPSRGRLAAAAGGCAGLTVAMSFALPRVLGLHGQTGRNVYLYADLVLAVGLTLAFLLAVVRRRVAGHRWAYVAAAALAVGLTGRALTIAAPTVRQLAHGRPLYSRTGAGLTAGLYRALDWIRAHTSPSAVIAVNNFRDWSLYWSDGWAVPDDFYYSAFSERRVFLEGWIYTQAASQAPNAVYYGHQLLFPDRVRLNNAIFQWAHSDALRVAAWRYGVRYLLVDRIHNAANPHLGRIARRLFADRDAAVYAVPPLDTKLVSRHRGRLTALRKGRTILHR